MKVLITGATGLVGKILCAALSTRGHELRVLTRDVEKAKASLDLPAQFYVWDAAREKVPAEAVQGIEWVFHLAGDGIADSRWTDERKKQIYDSRVLGSQNLMASLEGVETLKFILSASAIGYYGDCGELDLDERAQAGDDFLSRVCVDWEKAILSPNLPGVRRAITRIGVVLDRHGGALKKLIPVFQMGLGGPLGSGEQWMSWIHLRDLVNLMLYIADHPTMEGPINAVSPHPVRNADFGKALGKALHRPAILKTPVFALKLTVGELADFIVSSQKCVPSKALDAGFDYQFPRIENAFEDIVPG